ncbi:MAG TPA: helix-turn-helix domain-containing protein [Candidatus Gemmiger avicola]|uniref:Helix-turn-helix domain-containing protein n=1 Tax=Candidatus Gemmiger avicola TaxID=2838605 RepID=A0A9D2S2M7_9FIRM|nr:helix-turn-helix domain-containing protein [Candidatus Gemmiger avicola]
MPKEPVNYRDTLDRVRARADELYPGKLIYTISEAAKILGVGRSTMYRWGFRKFTTAEQIARKIC